VKLVATFDQEGSGTQETVYEGALVSEMGEALEAFILQFPERYQKHMRRWWERSGRPNTENGLEPELRLLGAVGVDVYKVWQTPIGS
jgi:hypothetical protein